MAKDLAVDIEEIEKETVQITIKGQTPLIVHSWSEKAKRQILESQMKTKMSPLKEAKVPVNDFMSSLYWLSDFPGYGKNNDEAKEIWDKAVANSPSFGFPVNGIKESIVSGAYRAGLSKDKVSLYGTFFLHGIGGLSNDDYAEIKYENVEMREDMVRVGGQSKSADIRYRACFTGWEIPMVMKYHKNGQYSLKQILNMINYGGFCVGIGEWRPERKGQFGMYELKTK